MRSLPESVPSKAAVPSAPLPSAPLVVTLLARADAAPEKTAFVGPAGELSYGALARTIGAAAARIARAIGAGDRVVLCGPNSPQLAAAYFAVHAAGGVAVPVDAGTPDDGLRWIVEDSEASLVLLGGARSTGLSPVPIQDLGDITRADETQPLCSPRSTLDAPADLLYTTGTTGRRKGVLLTHENIAQAALNINTFVGTTAEDREVMPLPLAHSFGLGRLRRWPLLGTRSSSCPACATRRPC